jgi:hypothetical protein
VRVTGAPGDPVARVPAADVARTPPDAKSRGAGPERACRDGVAGAAEGPLCVGGVAVPLGGEASPCVVAGGGGGAAGGGGGGGGAGGGGEAEVVTGSGGGGTGSGTVVVVGSGSGSVVTVGVETVGGGGSMARATEGPAASATKHAATGFQRLIWE